MIMCYNFFVGMCSRCSELIQALEKHLSFIMESEKSKSVSQQPINQWKEQARGSAYAGYKNWQVLFTAFAFSCLESYRDFSPLKRVMISRDWARMANRLVPPLGQGTTMQSCLSSFV